MILKFFKKSSKNAVKRQFDFLDTGFHGDEYLLGFVGSLIKGCEYFIETGANVGTTLAYVARTYPGVKCISCEPDKDAFNEAVKNTAEYANVDVYNQTSQDFINFIRNERREVFSKECLFWLDAHGYGFEWPMKDELSFITSNFEKGFIFIDDFKVPGLDCFKYDVYKDQICSFDYVKGSLDPKRRYRLYYPAYTDKTSKHHPLTGWGLIEFGHEEEIELPEALRVKIQPQAIS